MKHRGWTNGGGLPWPGLESDGDGAAKMRQDVIGHVHGIDAKEHARADEA